MIKNKLREKSLEDIMRLLEEMPEIEHQEEPKKGLEIKKTKVSVLPKEEKEELLDDEHLEDELAEEDEEEEDEDDVFDPFYDEPKKKKKVLIQG